MSDKHDFVLGLLKESYEARGYEFVANPPSELLGSLLGNLKPDAIAVKGDKRIAIEIVSGRQPPRLEPGLIGPSWEHSVVYLGDIEQPEDSIETPARKVRELVQRRLRDVRCLQATAQFEAALIVGWGVLEASLRQASPELISKPLAPLSTVEALQSYGFITQAMAQRLRRLIPMRNAIAHGSSKGTVKEGDVRFLVDIIEMITHVWMR